MEPYSVLMSVYHKEKAEYLRAAMESIWKQTIPTDDFVLVCDGPLTGELDEVIAQMQEQYGERLQVKRIPENVGLGLALNYGLHFCRSELIARMDSDDISCPDRCEKQLREFETHPEITICSGTVQEFSVDPSMPEARRELPETSEEIHEFARKRNPFNHPCVMYRKAAVEAAGSYKDFYLLEDYYLWVRMLLAGNKGRNIKDTILYMRAGSDMYKRRAGIRYAGTQIRLFSYMRKKGFISFTEFIQSVVLRAGSSLAPNWCRQLAFRLFLRK